MFERVTGEGHGVFYLSLCGAVVLCFVVGAYGARFGAAPFPELVEPYFQSFVSPKRARLNRVGGPTPPKRWNAAALADSGVVHHRSEGAPNGAVLYSSADRPRAVLVDSDGAQLHTWMKAWSQVWSDPAHLDASVSGERAFWPRVELLSDGELLAIYTVPGTVPYGYGMVKLDANSEIVWRYGAKTHHDFDRGRDGRIFALVHEMRDLSQRPVSGLHASSEEVLADGVGVVSPDGEPLRRISLLEAFADSPYRSILEMHPTTLESDEEKDWDVLHANAIAAVGSGFASHHSFAEPGDLLISCRTPDVVALLDPAREKIVWATRGYWWQPTDVVPMDNGRILVVDSNGHGGEGFPSRLVEFRPDDQTVSWIYSGSTEAPFWAVQGGSVEVVSERRVLFTSPELGRIEMLTREGERIWEYRNPVRRRREGARQVAAVWGARRAEPSELGFLGAPGGGGR